MLTYNGFQGKMLNSYNIIDVGGKLMKKFILVILTVFMVSGAFCTDWKYSYDRMIEMKEISYESYFAVPNKDLYDLTVYVWKKYFAKYYNVYGIPFIACYDNSIQDFENATAYHNPVRDALGRYQFSIICIIDKTHKKGFNAATVIEKAINEEDWDNQYANELIAHELCHLIVSMEWTAEQEELFSAHYNSVFLREANRLLLDYDLDVHVY